MCVMLKHLLCTSRVVPEIFTPLKKNTKMLITFASSQGLTRVPKFPELYGTFDFFSSVECSVYSRFRCVFGDCVIELERALKFLVLFSQV